MVSTLFPEKLCRLCLKVEKQLEKEYEVSKKIDKIAHVISRVTNINITKEDVLPIYVCYQCIKYVYEWHDYRDKCTRNQTLLERCIATNTVMDFEKEWPKYILNFILVESKSLPEAEPNDKVFEDNLLAPIDISDNDTVDNVDNHDLVPENINTDHFKTITSTRFTRKSCRSRATKLPVKVKKVSTVKCPKSKLIPANNPTKSTAANKPGSRGSGERKVWIDESQRTKYIDEFETKFNNIGTSYVLRNVKSHEIRKMGEIISNAYGSGSYRRLAPLRELILELPYVASFKCKDCDEHFPTVHYVSHVTAEHNRTVSYPCDFCGEYLQEKYIEHWVTHFMNYKCDQCMKHFSNERMLRRHQRKVCLRQRHECDLCGMTFRFRYYVSRHKRAIHFNEVIRRKEVACHICGKVVRSISVHMKSHNDVLSWLCPHCGRAFKTKQTMERHVETHSTENKKKPHLCQYCGAEFRTKPLLTRHVRNHEGVYPHRCELCPKKYTSLSSLQSHMTSHTDERKYVCDTCGKACKTRQHLRTHMAVHNDFLPYGCPLCNKRVRYRGNYSKHLETHRKRGEFVPDGTNTNTVTN